MNIHRVCFAGHLTAEPEVNYTPKVTAVVSASIANNEFYGCLALVLGTSTTIVITTKANPTGTTTAPTARRSTCICEQMPVSELAVMVQGCRQLQSAGRA